MKEYLFKYYSSDDKHGVYRYATIVAQDEFQAEQQFSRDFCYVRFSIYLLIRDLSGNRIHSEPH